MRKIADLRILLPWPSRYMPQDQAPTATRKIAMALGPLLEIRRAYRTGANPPGGGPSWRTGMSLTLAIPGFFLICASVIFFLLCGIWWNGNDVRFAGWRLKKKRRARLMCGVMLVCCSVYESYTLWVQLGGAKWSLILSHYPWLRLTINIWTKTLDSNPHQKIK